MHTEDMNSILQSADQELAVPKDTEFVYITSDDMVRSNTTHSYNYTPSQQSGRRRKKKEPK